ncbi:anhydro-N-acetylmuramic acid kinase [Aquisphaera insulae]|uniref:anhydro-N-acetylmuramic acid kinase n=1 Tax=Aquisphaera insulae TaxID=2712864 RepID=UPI0013EAF8CA|nr:anhydro-N-acetylmuramic acid kinase [Aquisphaera insulae]
MSTPIQRLVEPTRKNPRIVAGLMSGTSADSIDVAICSIVGDGVPGPGRPGATVTLLHYHEAAHEPETRRMVLELDKLNVRTIAELNVRLGAAFAEACAEGLRRAGLAEDELDLVGSHGQTVYHHSSVPGAIKATLQLGDGDVIAERLGVPVVSDFRARDIAAGGEGAPISPYADLVLFGSSAGTRRAVLNLGGIANVTVLDPDPAAVLGFDTGPANSLLDRLARRLTDGRLPCDRDGQIARAGKVDEPLVARLLREDSYLDRRPPKSTGFEMYGDAFVDHAAGLLGRCDADLMATLTEFTARSIAGAFAAFVPPRDEVIAAGGGVRNPALLGRIAALLAPARVRISDELGVPGDAREAMAFAILANEAIHGHATALPSVTGARRAAVLGKLSFPS